MDAQNEWRGGLGSIKISREKIDQEIRALEKSPFPDKMKRGSSPNWLTEFFMKACQGPGRKVRLRSKHRRDISFP
jgi:hypothetical protein